MSWVQNGRKENTYDPVSELERETKVNSKMVKILVLFLNLPTDMKVLVNHQVIIFSQNILPYLPLLPCNCQCGRGQHGKQWLEPGEGSEWPLLSCLCLAVIVFHEVEESACSGVGVLL